MKMSALRAISQAEHSHGACLAYDHAIAAVPMCKTRSRGMHSRRVRVGRHAINASFCRTRAVDDPAALPASTRSPRTDFVLRAKHGCTCAVVRACEAEGARRAEPAARDAAPSRHCRACALRCRSVTAHPQCPPQTTWHDHHHRLRQPSLRALRAHDLPHTLQLSSRQAPWLSASLCALSIHLCAARNWRPAFAAAGVIVCGALRGIVLYLRRV